MCDVCGGDRRHSGGFLLRIMPPSWHPVPACTPRLRCRRAVLRCRDDCCRRAVLLCRYEIRIGRGDRCRYDRSRRNHSSLPQPRLESGAGRCRGRDRMPRLCCRRAILLCQRRRLVSAAERRCRYDRSRRNHSSLPQQRLESGAGRCRGRDRRHSGGFLLRIMPPSWHPVPACIPRLRCRRVILLCSNDGAASIPKFGPEIKNRCTQEGGIGEKLASIPKSGPEIKNRCTQEGGIGENTCIDSQVWA